MEENAGYLEWTVGNGAPEVGVLFPMIVGTRSVADNAETEERYLIYMTNLGDSSWFHVDGQSCGESCLDGVELLAVGDKFVSATDESAVDGCFCV